VSYDKYQQALQMNQSNENKIEKLIQSLNHQMQLQLL